MGALPRPELPPGPQHDLVDALHVLHHEAGWPSLRTLARKAGCSHTTVSNVFSSPRLPPWGVVALLVEAMDGDTAGFHDLWLASGRPAAPSPVARLAGRRHELLAVRRHLASGTGLLLVTGEAGMGKTALVSAAAAGSETFVATGACRPLSTEVPLLPVADLLRHVRREHAAWFDEALAACPRFVATSLGQIMPELAGEQGPEVSDAWARQQLFQAVDALLAGLRERGPLGLLVEDAHWGDATTLDLLDLLGSHACPLVVTVRTDDPDVDEAFGDWLARARRLPGATSLALAPLTPAETAQQLTLLHGRDPDPEDVARIHARSLGQPLFTEQLALHPDDRPLPQLLGDLLLRRLRGLSPHAWAVARALGVADRPLLTEQLARITGLDPVPGLRELDSHRLLGPADRSEVRLRHPLVAEAIREHLVAGEAAEVHRRVASALAVTPDPPAAEIAQHWAAAGDAPDELRWRIAAARAASASYAVEAASLQWLRVLELWPAELDGIEDPPLTRTGMYVAALDALARVDTSANPAVYEQALLAASDAAPEHAAVILRRVGSFRAWQGDREEALALTSRAVAMHELLPPSADHVWALLMLGSSFESVGRFRETAELGARAVAQARRLGSPSVLKQALAERAWSQGLAGDTTGARESIEELTAIVLDPPDPYCEIEVAVCATDMLLMSGAPAGEVFDVARTALHLADSWNLHHWEDAILRCNVAEALVAQGHPDRAWDLVGPYTEGDPAHDRWPLHEQRAVLELLGGREAQARQHVTAVEQGPLPHGGLTFRVGHHAIAATIELWTGRPDHALGRALPVLESGIETQEPAMLAPLLILAARAAADLGDPARGAQVRDLHHRLTGDPFARHPQLVTPAAQGATWTAELARLEGQETVDHWVTAAAAWDRLMRPYDAAYCRWRGAQVARMTSQGTLAGRLLKRAALDARGHVPLSGAIRGTVAELAGPRRGQGDATGRE